MRVAIIAVMLLATQLAFAADEQPATPATAPSIEDAAAVVDSFHAALTKGDRDAALAVMADEVGIFEQGWVERSKAEYASHHLASDSEFSKAVTSAQTARTGAIVGDLAYVATESKTTGRYKDKDVDVIALETMVLRRTESGWRIVHIHWSSRKAKE
jgi:ketosteroid isomerase-like protein